MTWEKTEIVKTGACLGARLTVVTGQRPPAVVSHRGWRCGGREVRQPRW